MPHSHRTSTYVNARRRTSTHVDAQLCVDVRRRASKLKTLTYVDVRYVNGPLRSRIFDATSYFQDSGHDVRPPSLAHCNMRYSIGYLIQRHFCCRVYRLATNTRRHRQTDGQTDRRHHDDNSRSYCVAVRSAKIAKLQRSLLTLTYYCYSGHVKCIQALSILIIKSN